MPGSRTTASCVRNLSTPTTAAGYSNNMNSPKNSEPDFDKGYYKTVARRTVKALVVIGAIILLLIIGFVLLLIYLLDKLLT